MISCSKRPLPARRFYLTDAQLGMIADAAQPLPLPKKGLLWSRTMAWLNLHCSGPQVTDVNVTDAIRHAMQGLVHRGVA